MVPPTWDDRQRVAHFADSLRHSDRPTAVAVSLLDIAQPANTEGPDYYAHWNLTHFLLDGHHNVHAAAQIGRPLQLLSLLSVDAGLCASVAVADALDVRSRPAGQRPQAR